jgi:hypothetical protein
MTQPRENSPELHKAICDVRTKLTVDQRIIIDTMAERDCYTPAAISNITGLTERAVQRHMDRIAQCIKENPVLSAYLCS